MSLELERRAERRGEPYLITARRELALGAVDSAIRHARITLYGASAGAAPSAGELELERAARAELELAPALLTEGVDRGELERELAVYLEFWNIARELELGATATEGGLA